MSAARSPTATDLLALLRDALREARQGSFADVVERIARVLQADPDYRVADGRAAQSFTEALCSRSTIDVFRATPRGTHIRPGDWVAIDGEYARRHLRGDSTQIVTTTISLEDLLWAGTDENEFFFAPKELAKPDESSLWDAIQATSADDINWLITGARDHHFQSPKPKLSPSAQVLQLAGHTLRGAFKLDWSHTHHGVAHWTRVWINGRELAREYDINPMIPAWFAFLHDIQRHDEGLDAGHGARAAGFAQSLYRQGTLQGLSGREVDLLCEAIDGHSDGLTEAHRAVQICWDADRLDLGRVGIYPDPRRLCTPHGRRLIPTSYARSVGEKASPLPLCDQLDDEESQPFRRYRNG